MADEDATVEEMRTYVGVLPSMFATSPVSRAIIKSVTAESADEVDSISFQYGIPPKYSGPVEKGGKYITRQMVNALGQIGSQAAFFEQCGGYYTFDERVCSEIGGYPKDAVLSFYDEGTGLFRRVRSLVDDNKWNFLLYGVDGVHWTYVDDIGMMTMHVDYSDSEDIADRLFLDSGEPEWIEVDENSVLNCFASGFIDIIANEKYLARKSDSGYYSPYFSNTSGYSVLDISGSGGGFKSLRIGSWLSTTSGNHDGSRWYLEYESQITAFGASVMVGAGDRIRVRNYCYQSPKQPTDPVFANFPQESPIPYVGIRNFPAVGVADADWDRAYLTKAALLSPVRFKKA